MSISVLKLLKMEATTKANDAAAAAAESSAQTADGAGGGGGGAEAGAESNSEFYNTGRVGRRNALPDILNHHHSTTSTADLPDKLGALSTSGEQERERDELAKSSVGGLIGDFLPLILRLADRSEAGASK